jgi:hypothetical protein
VIDRAGARGWGLVTAWAVALTAVLIWPVTRAGYLLGHDMVFTPRQPLDLASVGLSSASPRAVPLDALVALSGRVVDGAVVARLAVVLPLLAAGVGAAALLHRASLPGRLAACGWAIWNPYVVERLALGQWALLWGYAALPWIVLATTRGRGWLARALAIAAASITPTGGVLAAVTAVTTAATTRQPQRDVLRTAALAVVLQLPWIVPALVSTSSSTSDPRGVAAFASRAEHPGGAVLSLLGGGGIWDADVVPGSRDSALPWLALVLLAAAAYAARHRLVDLLGRRVLLALGWLAGVGLVLALASSLPGLDAVVRGVVQHVPGAGLLRDAQKWVAPLVLVEALVVGAAADALATRPALRPWRLPVWIAALALPVLLLPDAAATLRPTLEPVHYPHDWAAVAKAADGGQATVLPFASYRAFAWVSAPSVLDPAPRLLRIGTVVDDRLSVSGRLLTGEDSRARRLAAAFGSGSDLPRRLAAEGIRWVVVEHGTPGSVPDLSGLEMTVTGRDVSLYRVPGAVRSRQPSTAATAAVLAADGLALVTLAALLMSTLVRRRRPRGWVGG